MRRQVNPDRFNLASNLRSSMLSLASYGNHLESVRNLTRFLRAANDALPKRL
jgi:hypothetical protein